MNSASDFYPALGGSEALGGQCSLGYAWEDDENLLMPEDKAMLKEWDEKYLMELIGEKG